MARLIAVAALLLGLVLATQAAKPVSLKLRKLPLVPEHRAHHKNKTQVGSGHPVAL